MKTRRVNTRGIIFSEGKLLLTKFRQDDGGESKLEYSQDYNTIDLETTTHGTLELTTWKYVDPKKEYVLPSFLSNIDI